MLLHSSSSRDRTRSRRPAVATPRWPRGDPPRVRHRRTRVPPQPRGRHRHEIAAVRDLSRVAAGVSVGGQVVQVATPGEDVPLPGDVARPRESVDRGIRLASIPSEEAVQHRLRTPRQRSTLRTIFASDRPRRECLPGDVGIAAFDEGGTPDRLHPKALGLPYCCWSPAIAPCAAATNRPRLMTIWRNCDGVTRIWASTHTRTVSGERARPSLRASPSADTDHAGNSCARTASACWVSYQRV